MHHYCTLFDRNYLFQGIALYRSLEKTTNEFRLYVLCMDQTTYDMLRKLNQRNLVPIHLSEIVNDDEIRRVREGTTHGQFCWVSQPLACIYILDRFNVDMVTYLEADSIFFNDPEVLFEELGAFSVSLVPHRYTPKFNKAKTSGKYCVQFNAFRNDSLAREVLNYWKYSCFKYSKERPDYYPGQVTLDDWPIKFPGVKEIEHRGAGVAPWNVQQYNIHKFKDKIFVDDVPLIFYHFHQYSQYEDGSHELGAYPLTANVLHEIYSKYISELRDIEKWVQTLDPEFIYKRKMKKSKNPFRIIGSSVLRKIKGTYNIYDDDFFKHHADPLSDAH